MNAHTMTNNTDITTKREMSDLETLESNMLELTKELAELTMSMQTQQCRLLRKGDPLIPTAMQFVRDAPPSSRIESLTKDIGDCRQMIERCKEIIEQNNSIIG